MPQLTLSGEPIGRPVPESDADEFEFDWWSASQDERMGVLRKILRKVRERKYAREELEDLFVHYPLSDGSHWTPVCGKHPECGRQGCARTCFRAHEAMLIHKLVRCGDTTPAILRRHEELLEGEKQWWLREWRKLRSQRENETLEQSMEGERSARS